MMINKFKLSTCLALVFGAVSFAPMVHAQAYKADVKKPDFDALPSPDIKTNKDKSFKPKDWLEMEVQFEVDAKPMPKDKFVDRVTIQWYAAVKKRDGAGYWLLNKNVEHVNVKIGEKLFSSVYISPNTYERLTGSDKVSKGDIKAVGGAILINGVRVGLFSTESIRTGGTPWWEAASDALARTDKFPMLNKNETPFKILWYDRYAELAEEKR